MKKVKITILKTMLNEDLAKEYGICGLKACPMMKVGDVFYADYAKPEGFCDEAWKAIYLTFVWTWKPSSTVLCQRIGQNMSIHSKGPMTCLLMPNLR